MTNEELNSRVREVLENMTDSELIEAWNTRCENDNYMDDYIEFNNLDELLMDCTPTEVWKRIDHDEYNINDTYAVDTPYGYKSFDSADDDNSPIYLDDLVNYIIRECDDLGNSDIEDIFIEYDNDNMEGDEYTD